MLIVEVISSFTENALQNTINEVSKTVRKINSVKNVKELVCKVSFRVDND